MMGEHSGNQDRLFYSFNLDVHVPADHLLRGIDRSLDLDLRQHLAPFYTHWTTLGGPRSHGADAAGRLLLSRPLRTAAVRRSASEPCVSLVLPTWLEDKVPDHSSFSKNRHGRFRESDVFRHVFEGVVRRCMAEGLVRG